MIDSKTNSIYLDLQFAYNFYNEKLFDGKLQPTLMTLQRHKNMLGYIFFDRFSEKNGQKYLHELAMNSDYFAYRTTIETLSTLVHEMVHLAQRQFGNPSKQSYHDHEFKDMMFAVGLVTSHNGKPDGKPVGQKMDHYIFKGGKFLEVSIELLDMGFELPIYERHTPAYIKPAQFYREALDFIANFEDVLKPEYLRPFFLNEILLNKAKQELETSRMIGKLVREKDAISKPELTVNPQTDGVEVEEFKDLDEPIDGTQNNDVDSISKTIETDKNNEMVDDLGFEVITEVHLSDTEIIELKVDTVEDLITPIKVLLTVAEETLLEEPPPKPAKNKCKYQCDCGTNIWGKPNLNVVCGDCSKPFLLVG
jgi:predicted SprT family Zn-dependent metalloprotease